MSVSRCTCTRDGEGWTETRGCPVHDDTLALRQGETIHRMTVQIATLRHALEIAREQVGVLETRLAQIRPLTEAEWAVLMREHDVLHEARRLSNTPGAINTTRDLDRALKRYDEAVAVRDASTPASEPEEEA